MPEFIWVALLAAGLAWLGNCALLSFSRARAVMYLTPALEESAKTGLALFMGADIWLAHITFGFLEAVWDIAGIGARGLFAGLASVAGHAAFGLTAAFILQLTGSFGLTLLGSYALHMAWNILVARLVAYLKQELY